MSINKSSEKELLKENESSTSTHTKNFRFFGTTHLMIHTITLCRKHMHHVRRPKLKALEFKGGVGGHLCLNVRVFPLPAG